MSELLDIWFQPWFLHLYTHRAVGAVQNLWVWVCVVFMCRWGLLKMYLGKHILGVEKITGFIPAQSPSLRMRSIFAMFTFTSSAALCQVNAPWMHLTACWFHPSCPQGLCALWLVFVSPCQAAELRVNPTAPTGQHRAASKGFSGGGTGGCQHCHGFPALVCVNLGALCTQGDVQRSALLRADGRSCFSCFVMQRQNLP